MAKCVLINSRGLRLLNTFAQCSKKLFYLCYLNPFAESFDIALTAPTWRISLDACQYQQDITRLRDEKNRGKAIHVQIARAKREGRPKDYIEDLEKKAFEAEAASPEDIYDTFNVLVRRKPKENNFKAVLDTIR